MIPREFLRTTGIDHDRVIFLNELWGLLVDDRLRQSDHLDRKADVLRSGTPGQRRSLGVGVDDQDFWEELCEGAREVDGDRRLAAPALFTDHSDDETGQGIWRDLASKR
jgi:hypothetical protein